MQQLNCHAEHALLASDYRAFTGGHKHNGANLMTLMLPALLNAHDVCATIK